MGLNCDALTFGRRSSIAPPRSPAPDPPVCPRVSSPGTPDAPSSAARVPGFFCPLTPSVTASSLARTPVNQNFFDFMGFGAHVSIIPGSYQLASPTEREILDQHLTITFLSDLDMTCLVFSLSLLFVLSANSSLSFRSFILSRSCSSKSSSSSSSGYCCFLTGSSL